jgi:ubiquinone/menaquinone biosynthesis C-methylase UbiE
MYLSKRIDLQIENADKVKNAAQYIDAICLRARTSPFDKYRYAILSRLLKKRLLGKVLDIGCNIGITALSYSSYAGEVVLCDNDYFLIECARLVNKQDLSKFRFITGSVTELPFKDNYFDSIIFSETIEHLPKDKHDLTIKELLRVAKADAAIYISTPNKFSLAGLEGRAIELFVKNYKWNAWDHPHRYIYSSFEFIDFIKSHDVYIKNIYGSYFLPGSILVRFTHFLQLFFGFFSYLVARYFGRFPPFCYLGFTILVEFKKKNSCSESIR